MSLCFFKCLHKWCKVLKIAFFTYYYALKIYSWCSITRICQLLCNNLPSKKNIMLIFLFVYFFKIQKYWNANSFRCSCKPMSLRTVQVKLLDFQYIHFQFLTKIAILISKLTVLIVIPTSFPSVDEKFKIFWFLLIKLCEMVHYCFSNMNFVIACKFSWYVSCLLILFIELLII